MKKVFVLLVVLFGATVVPDVAFGNIKFTKDDSAVLAESFKQKFGDKADAAMDTFKNRYDKDNGIDADGMAAVFASGTDSKEQDGFSFKQFWTNIVEKIASIFDRRTSACKDTAFEQYCNRDFKNFHNSFTQNHQFLVDLYATTHRLSCSFDKTESGNNGIVRAICSGNDVMVFEFSDDTAETIAKDVVNIFCIASDGKLSNSGDACEAKFCDNENLKKIIAEIDAGASRKHKKGLRLSEHKNGSCKLKVYDDSLEREVYGGYL